MISKFTKPLLDKIAEEAKVTLLSPLFMCQMLIENF